MVASGALDDSPVTYRLPIEHGPYAKVALHLVRGSSHDVYVAASSTRPTSVAIAELFIFHVHFDIRLKGISVAAVNLMARPSLRPWICSDDRSGESGDGEQAPVGPISCLLWCSSVTSSRTTAALAVGYTNRGISVYSDDGCRTMTTLPRMLSQSSCTWTDRSVSQHRLRQTLWLTINTHLSPFRFTNTFAAPLNEKRTEVLRQGTVAVAWLRGHRLVAIPSLYPCVCDGFQR